METKKQTKDELHAAHDAIMKVSRTSEIAHCFKIMLFTHSVSLNLRWCKITLLAGKLNFYR